MEKYIVVSCPTAELSYSNKAILNPNDNLASFNHIAVRYPKKAEAFVYSVIADPSVKTGQIAFNASGRKWASLMTNSQIEAAPYMFDVKEQLLNTITFDTDFMTRLNAPKNVDFDTEDMARQFSLEFNSQAFTVGQIIGFSYILNNKRIVLELKVKDLQAIRNNESDIETSSVEIGLTTGNTVFLFERAEGSDISLIGGMTGKVAAPQIFTQNLDFSAMGIGGLSDQFQQIFRRAFASRLFPPAFTQSIGQKHARGILLYGPPGTGKTLIARQIGKTLLAREPKVVNGPEVLNKYVGESEANIRKLFAEAEEEQAKLGINSGLHVIIFDEIDALCKSRGNSASTSGVGDNVVNQLLSKIDGVDSLDNVLLIGMTNRKDLIDEALLRPGRLEVQIEIGLPDEQGRLEIFKIHTKKMSDSGILDEDVSLLELAAQTKNFTGAEIAGLVAAAGQYAMTRVIEPRSGVEVTKEMIESVRVTRKDFELAMLNDIKPALGASEDRLKILTKAIYYWDPRIESIMTQARENIAKTLKGVERTNTVLFVGDKGSGLTTLAAAMASESNFPFIRVFRAKDTAGKMESAAIQHMEKLFHDAGKSEQSCILFDDIDVILRYSHSGPRFSDNLRNVFFTNLDTVESAREHRLLIICTCRSEQAIRDLQIETFFQDIIRVPSLSSPQQVNSVLATMEENNIPTLNAKERDELADALGCVAFKMGVRQVQDIAQAEFLGQPGERVKNFIQKMHNLNRVQSRPNRFEL